MISWDFPIQQSLEFSGFLENDQTGWSWQRGYSNSDNYSLQTEQHVEPWGGCLNIHLKVDTHILVDYNSRRRQVPLPAGQEQKSEAAADTDSPALDG